MDEDARAEAIRYRQFLTLAVLVLYEIFGMKLTDASNTHRDLASPS